MKTKEQILRQIKLFTFDDSGEWKKVHKDCKELYGSGIGRPQRGKIACNYELFTEWLNNGYGVGDVVVCGNSLGIVSYQENETVALCAYLNMFGKLVNVSDNLYMANIDRLSKADQAQSDIMYRILTQNHLTIDMKNGCIVRRKPILCGSTWRFIYENEFYYGVVKQKRGEIVTFHYAYCKGKLIKSEVKVSKSDIYRPITETEENDMDKDILHSYNCQWRTQSGRFIYLPKRAKKGDIYYMLSDKFTICAMSDEHTKMHDYRYENGNYFNTYEEAVEFFKRIQEVREEIIKDKTINH